jgi:CRISPR-associated protein Csc1
MPLVFEGRLCLLDYLYFATVQLGREVITGRFVHNYALAYALGLARPQTLQGPRPRYEEDLQPLRQAGVYLTPAAPEPGGIVRRVQWNTVADAYAEVRRQSAGYPDWGTVQLIAPGARFRFYFLCETLGSLPPTLQMALTTGRALYIRLGKWMGKARVQFEQGQALHAGRGSFSAMVTAQPRPQPVYLNYRDLQVAPSWCDVLPLSAPTRLISGARFEDALYWGVRFADGRALRLPQAMGFLAGPP